jgi:hypothetical protein
MTENGARDGMRPSHVSAPEIGAHLSPRRVWRPLLGLALGLALLALAARGIDLRQVWLGVQEAEPLWVGLALLTVLLTTTAKVGRWRGLFREPWSLRFLSLGRALLVGQLVNALLPARLGEVARLYTLGRDEPVSRATALGTIAAEKTFDVLFLLVAAGLTAVLTSLPTWLHGALVGVAGLGTVILVAAAALPRRVILAAGRRTTSWLPGRLATWLTEALERGLVGLEGLRRPRLAALACAWSVVIWSLAAATNLALFRAFDLSLSIGAALLLLTLLHVGMAPPSSPGRLGVFHAITVAGLVTFGIDRATGLAYATVLHALVYGPQILLGGLALGLSPDAREVVS